MSVSPVMTAAHVADASAYLRTRLPLPPRFGLILGSGLNIIADRVSESTEIPYAEVPHWVAGAVAGHAKRLVAGRLGGAAVAVLQGRAHYYEGYDAAQITLPVRVLADLGVHTLIVTNAAGALRPGLRPGDLLMISDHLNLPGLAGHSPLRGPNDDRLGPRFPAMSGAYDSALRAALRREAEAQGIALQEGVYVMVAGPSFETPAEVRMLRALGGDVVGMSTVPEVIVARHAGLRVLGVSLISNVAQAAPERAGAAASHEEVLVAGEQAAPRLAGLLEALLAHLSSTEVT